ncbi:MAG: hypothetical protein ABIP06_00960 [Pyrinomonadaceae bacterium]
MMLKGKLIAAILIFFSFIAGCNNQNSKDDYSKNQISNNSVSNPESEKLPSQINLFIGRGGCCYGHIISINKNGDIDYVVGNYILNDNNDGSSKDSIPELYNPESIKIDKKYSRKNGKLSSENLKLLAQLLSDTKKIEFRDETLVMDDYLYQLYLDNKKIAYGYKSNLKNFPGKLQEIIKIIESEIKLNELPGMA